MCIFKKAFFSILLLPICLFSMKQGSWEETDKCGNPVVYEWQKITDYPIFLDVWTTLIPAFAEAFADNEREFLLDPITLQIKKEYVEIVNALPANDRWVPRIAIASADRNARVECWKQTALQNVEGKKAMLLMHPENLPNHTSTFFVLIAKSKTSDILGFAVFVMSHQDTSVGSAFCDVLGVVQNARGRGLARPLVLSILTVMPEIKHIHLKTRIWNTRALAIYKKLGFVECGHDGCGILLGYVRPEICDHYIGRYKFEENSIISITKEDNQLFEQTNEQPKLQLLPESETTFFLHASDMHISFVKDEKGTVTKLILHQRGVDQEAVKIE